MNAICFKGNDSGEQLRHLKQY